MTLRQRVAQASPALKFVVLVGIMSFFADFTYEGSRSIVGQYLGVLGAGALAIAVITGFGEFLGYAIRLVSGRGADRTGRYWPITIGGSWGAETSSPRFACGFASAVEPRSITKRSGSNPKSELAGQAWPGSKRRGLSAIAASCATT